MRNFWTLSLALVLFAPQARAESAPAPTRAAAGVVSSDPPATFEHGPEHLAASQQDSNAATEEPHAPRWYGWQTLLADGASAVLLIGSALAAGVEHSGGSVESHPVSYGLSALAVTTYVFGAPAVHLAHGQVGHGVESLVLRLGVPVGGALGGYALGALACAKSDSDVPCPAVTASFGGITGILAAIAIDASLIAQEPTPAPAGAFQWSPVIAVTPTGASAGLSARF